MNANAALLTLVLLAACSQADAPSETVEQAAKDVVDVVEGDVEPPAAGPYAPRNDCAELPGASQFLVDLNKAVAAHDADAMVTLAAQDIKLDFGEGSGTPELKRRLLAKDGSLWDELETLVDLGCAQNSQGGITLPWFFEQSIPFDASNGFIVTGQDVPLYSAPGTDAPVTRRLSWDAVQMVPRGNEREGFIEVTVPVTDTGPGDAEPVTGFVAEDMLRSQLDYRLTAASRNGRWRIISLLAGD